MPIFVEFSGNKSVLFKDLKLVKDHLSEFNLRREEFLSESKELLSTLDPAKCLYVGQREFATVRSDDQGNDFVGSNDATTCHIVLIVDSYNGNCSLCHFDGLFTQQGLNDMMLSLNRSCKGGREKNGYDLYIVGGFIEKKKYSMKLTKELIDLLSARPEHFNLKLFCCTELNDEVKADGLHYPIIYGIAYNVKTKKLFKCNHFEYKGPELAVRSARHFTSCKNISIYNTDGFQLIIGPFDYEPIEYAAFLRDKPRDFILKYFSTSPEQEPEDFVRNFKNTLEVMIEHPEPLKTYFTDNKPKIYRRVVGKLEWELVLKTDE